MKLQTKENFKICSKCNVEKPFSEYWKCSNFTFGVYPSCKECVKKSKKPPTKEQRKKYSSNYYIKNKESIKKRTLQYLKLRPDIRKKTILKFQYGISLEHYNNIQNIQNGFCAICKIKPEDHKLFVDHSHKTQKIRGLLCRKCNSLLGFCNDKKEILESAIIYLNKEIDYGNVPVRLG